MECCAAKVGSVSITVEASTIDYLEETLWVRLMQLVDDNGDGRLQKPEFHTLMTSLGNGFSNEELDSMFQKADSDQDGGVSEKELAKYVTEVRQSSGVRFLKQVRSYPASHQPHKHPLPSRLSNVHHIP